MTEPWTPTGRLVDEHVTDRTINVHKAVLAIEREAAAAERERLWETVKPVLDMLPTGYGRDPRFAAMWDAFHPEATDD